MSLQTSGNVVMAAILMLLAGAQNSLALSSQSLCAVTGSIVNIPCSIYDSSITERQWYQVQRSDGESQDLSTNPQYSGRVSISTLRNDCTLTIKDVTGSDSGVYNFRFRTQGDEWIYFSPGVTLTVTDLQVKVDPETVGQREVKLTCSSTCNITEALWSRWFWNEVYWGYRPGASIVLNSTILDNQGSFSCRMSGSEHHSPAVYPPRNTRAVMVPSGERVEGDSVTLTCSSDANPPVLTYSWFKQRAAADTLLGTGQNYSITNISSQHSGLYYCTAHNQLGHHNSTTVLLDVLRGSAEWWEQPAVWGAAGLLPVLTLSLITAVLHMKRKRGAERNADIQTAPKPGDDTYTALDTMNMTSDYSTLQQIRDSSSHTYSALNPATMSSEYDTLRW